MTDYYEFYAQVRISDQPPLSIYQDFNQLPALSLFKLMLSILGLSFFQNTFITFAKLAYR